MKKYLSVLGRSLLIGLLLVSAHVTYAVVADPVATPAPGALNTSAITNLSASFINLLNTAVVPFVFALAFIVFIWGVFQAFIVNGTNEEKRREGTQFIMWAIIGFVVMISIWGLVNIAKSILPADNNARPSLPCFDKDPAKCNQ